MNKLKFLIFLLISFVLIIEGQATTDLNQAQGFAPNTRFYSSGGDENINIMNGNLMLNYTDASQPGRNGMNPGVGRIYNSKIWRPFKKWVEVIRDDGLKYLIPKDSAYIIGGNFGTGWRLNIPRIKLNTKDNPFFISLTTGDGSEHVFEKLKYVVRPGDEPSYSYGTTVDSTFYKIKLIKFKKTEVERVNPNVWPKQDYIYTARNDNSKIIVWAKDGTKYEGYPNRRDYDYDIENCSIPIILQEDEEMIKEALSYRYPDHSEYASGCSFQKIEDVNGNFYTINYSTTDSYSGFINYEVNLNSYFLTSDFEMTTSLNSEFWTKFFYELRYNIKIYHTLDDMVIPSESTTPVAIIRLPVNIKYRFGDLIGITDSNGFKVNLNYVDIEGQNEGMFHVVSDINYLNSNNERIKVEYNYNERLVTFPAEGKYIENKEHSIFLEKINYLLVKDNGDEEELINSYIFDYNETGHLCKIVYPTRNNLTDPKNSTEGLIEFKYKPYQSYIPSSIHLAFYKAVASKAFVEDEQTAVEDPVLNLPISALTFGVSERTEDKTKVTKYFRGIKDSVLLGGYPREVTVVHPDETYEIHNYYYGGVITTGFYGTYISNWDSGYEKSVEYYEGPYSIGPFQTSKIVQKVDFEWGAGDFIDITNDGVYDYCKNKRLKKKTIRKYNYSDNGVQERIYETENLKYDEFGNIKRMINKRDLEDPTDDIIIVNRYLHETKPEYINKNILNKVLLTTIKDADGNILKKTRFKYDQFIPKNYGIDTEQKYEDVNLDPSKLGEIYRGNLTTLITYIAEQDEEGTFNWDNAIEVKRYFTYDIFGNLVSSKDPNGNTSKVTYDDTYNYALPEETINALDQKSEISYYPNTYLVKTSTDMNGNQISNEYDSLDRIIRTNYPKTAGTYTTYEYHDEIFPAYTVVRNNIEGSTFSESVYYYDGMGRFIYGGVKEDVKGGIDFWVVNGVDYNLMGRKNNVYEPQKDFGINLNNFRDPRENLEDPSKDLNYIKYEYDVLGRTKKVFIPDAVEGNTAPLAIIYDYDDFENSVKITDVKGQPIKYYYNSQAKLKTVEELDENGDTYSKTRFRYDLMGNMIKMRTSKDGENWMVSEYTYDSEGRLIKSVLPDSGESTFIYDLNGNLSERTDAKGITIKYYYDELNRQTKIEYPDGIYIQYEYDNLSIPNGKGKLYSKRKYKPGEGIVSENLFSDFDDMGRLLEKQEFINFEGHNPVQVNHNYSYNNAGFMLSHDIAVNGQEIQRMEYQYDLMGRADVLYETVMGDSTTNTEIARIRNFNQLGMIEDIEYANNISVQYTYNEYRHWMEDMEIVSKGTSIFKNEYFYDVVGNRTKLKDENNVFTTYEYDSLYRLIKVNGIYYNKEGQIKGSKYTYDQVGNRLTYDSKYGKITYEYDGSSNRLNRVNFNLNDKDMSYMLINYDLNGNTIQRDYFRNKDEIFEQELYEYNYDNMMVYYVRHKPVMKNNRIEMEVESELNMKYDVNGMRVVKECYPNTSDSTIYIYEGGDVVLEMTYEQIPKNKHLFTYAGGKKVSRTSFKDDGTIDLDSRKFFHQNFLGSITMITDKDGNIEEHNKFEPFGEIIWSKSYVDTDNNYKFTGKEKDKESNLDYFNARYLDTKLGRFMKADMVTGNIKNPQSLNRWVYCNNNPIKFIDPDGLLNLLVIEGSFEGRGLWKAFWRGFRNYRYTSCGFSDFCKGKGDTRTFVEGFIESKMEAQNFGSMYDIVLYKGHGVEREKSDYLGWLVFSGEIPVRPDELNFNNISNRLIILAGCNTGRLFTESNEAYGIKSGTIGRVFLGTKKTMKPEVLDGFLLGFARNLKMGLNVKQAAIKAWYYAGNFIHDKYNNAKPYESLTEEEMASHILNFHNHWLFIGDPLLKLEYNPYKENWIWKIGGKADMAGSAS